MNDMELRLTDITLTDDLDQAGGMDPDTYVDAGARTLLPKGTYGFKILKYGQRKDKSGQPVNPPVIVLNSLEVTDAGSSAAGMELSSKQRVYPYQDVRTKTFERRTTDGRTVTVSPLRDLLRAFDQTIRTNGLRHELELLQEFIDQGATFRGAGDWTAFDNAAYREAKSESGLGTWATLSDGEKKLYNEISDKCRARGMFKFERQSDGKIAPFWRGPSGELIKANFEITRYIPSLEVTALGPVV